MPFTSRRPAPALVVAIALAALILSGCQDYFASGWGLNTSGQVGDGSKTNSSVPVKVQTSGALAGKTITGVSAGYSHSCALTSAATVACWGSNTYGELGASVGTQSDVPVAIEMTGVLSGKSLSEVSAGNGSTCVVTTDGAVACRGRLGNQEITGTVAGGIPRQISVGGSHACVLTSRGTVACWGDNARGQLGHSSLTRAEGPVAVDTSGVLAGKTVISITAGSFHTCALTRDGDSICWGSGLSGELGNNTLGDSAVPVAVGTEGVLADVEVVAISAGHHFTCAALSDGAAACWGWNARGQLGNPTAPESTPTPVEVDTSAALNGQTVTGISSGYAHACATGASGGAACWGLRDTGQLGDGVDLTSIPPDSIRPTPVPVANEVASAVESLDAGGFHTAAVNHNSGPTHFFPLPAYRVMDTRISTPSRPAGPVSPGERLSVNLAGVVPGEAAAVAFNLTATGQQAPGYAEVTPSGQISASSTLNWTGSNQTVANAYVAKLSNGLRLDIALSSAGSSHFVLDITGYFAVSEGSEGSVYNAANARVYEFGNGDPPLAPGESRTVSLHGVDTGTEGVTPNAAALNVVVTGSSGPGVLTVSEERSTTTSSVNWTGANQMVANAVLTGVSPEGAFTLTNNGMTPVEVTVDLTGSFVPVAQGGRGAQFFPLEPARVYDSRITGQPLNSGQVRLNTYPVPVDSVAVAVNATVTGTSGSGYLTLNPLNAVFPLSSSVNWYQSATTVANGSVSASTGNATFAYVGGRYRSHYVLDLAGYFR